MQRSQTQRVIGLLATVLALAGGALAHPANVSAARAAAASAAATSAAATSAAASHPLALAPVAYLPGILNDYDPTYADPFGAVMYDGATNAYGLGQMQAAGSHWVTTYLNWDQIEPTAPVSNVHHYYWSGFDLSVSQAQAAGVSLYILFNGNPGWAAALPGGPVTDTRQLVSFVSVMANRYNGNGDANDAPGHPIINDWSFYAEPDNGALSYALQRKGYWGNNPAGYAAMLSQVAPAIHAANPQARVLIGGLAYDWFTTDAPNPGPYVRSFLTNTLQALNSYPGGAPHYLDAFAFHFYPISPQRWPTIREKALELQGILNRNGAGALPLLVPEMGFWSDPITGSSETLQAQTLVQTYARGLSLGLQQLSWFAVFDYGPGAETVGLFRNGDLAQPKPAYTAYATLSAQLTGFHYARAFAAAGVEGYVFRRLGRPDKTVLWATTSPAAATFAQACVRRVGLLGQTDQVVDGDVNDADQAANGAVTLALAMNEPVYVTACS